MSHERAGAQRVPQRPRLSGVTDSARCYLPTQEQVLVASLLDPFPDDVAERPAGVLGDIDAPLPRLCDVRNGFAEVEEGPPHKQPDWTSRETAVRLTRR
jgi:hypothetical protein